MDVDMLEDQIPAAELRALYVSANLHQRYRVVLDRIQNPEHGPNQLVTAVAALEGFARAVAVKYLVSSTVPLDVAYAQVRRLGPIELLVQHVLPALGTNAEAAFDSTQWQFLPQAIEFRNLLVHEATYLHGGTCATLIRATLHVFDRVADLSGAKR
jgi:hypothetical protein